MSPAGRPLKDPKAGRRIMVSYKVKPATVKTVKQVARQKEISQGELIDLWAEAARPASS